MARQLTIRGVSPELGRRLEKLSKAKALSVNATVLQLLERAVGLDERKERFRRYATWSEADFRELEESLRLQRQVDHALWE